MMKKVMLLLLAVFVIASWGGAIGIFCGAVWGLLNVYLIKVWMSSLLIEVPKNYVKISMITLVKFPMLYGLGYLMLLGPLSPWSWLTGFFIILIINSCPRFWDSHAFSFKGGE